MTSISDCEALEKTVLDWSALQGPASRPKPTLTASERVKRATVHWEKVARLLVVSRLIDPGSEFRVHRQWFDQSAMAEFVMLYELTGTNIEGEGEEIPKAKYGYSPDKRCDCKQENRSR